MYKWIQDKMQDLLMQMVNLQLQQSQLIDSMRNIALEVSRLAQKNQLESQFQSPKKINHSKINSLRQPIQPVNHFMTEAQAASQWEQKIREQQMQYQKQAKANLQNLIKSTSNRPKQLILNQLMSGELLPSHNQPPLCYSNNYIYAQTAPSSPRKKIQAPITPKKFNQTVNRLYESKQKRNQKIESLKYMQYQEEQQNMRQKPQLINQSRKLAKKNSLPIYTQQRLKIQADKKEKKMELLRKQTDEIKRIKEIEQNLDLEKNMIGLNAQKKTESQWVQKVDKQVKSYFNNIKSRQIQNDNKYKDLQFKPCLNSHSVKITKKLNKQNPGEKVQDRLHKYDKNLQLKKNLIEQRLQPSFKPKLTSSSQRIHHRTTATTTTTTTTTTTNSVVTENNQETHFQVSALQSQNIVSQYGADDIIQEEDDKEDFEDESNQQNVLYQQKLQDQHRIGYKIEDEYHGNRYQAGERYSGNPSNIATMTQQSIFPQLIQNVNLYPENEQNNQSDKSLHEIGELTDQTAIDAQNKGSEFWEESIHRGSGVFLDPALFIGMNSIKPYSQQNEYKESIQNQQEANRMKEQPINSYKQSTAQSNTCTISPMKEKQPLSEKRKNKLSSFMTGSSNASSSKRGSTQSQKDFFSFKEKIQNQV